MEKKGSRSSFLPKMPTGLGFGETRSHQDRKHLQEDVSVRLWQISGTRAGAFEGGSKLASIQSQEQPQESVESKLGLHAHGTW